VSPFGNNHLMVSANIGIADVGFAHFCHGCAVQVSVKINTGHSVQVRALDLIAIFSRYSVVLHLSSRAAGLATRHS
jgi:hypothetical protein